jgi:hypothetical protein
MTAPVVQALARSVIETSMQGVQMSNHNAATHGEHVRWAREHFSMREDVQSWRAHLVQAIDQLVRCEGILRSHEEAMLEHLAALDRHENEMRLHELSVISEEVGPFPSLDDPMRRSHAEEARGHACEVEAHERIKRNYRQIVSELQRLVRVLEQPL